MKKIRTFPGYETQDEGSLANLMYNKAAGAEKNTDVGKHLLPLNDGAGGFTTDATTARKLPAQGKNISVYNKSGTAESITLGETSAVASLAIGVTDVNGHVGIPCKPNDWTNIACSEQDWVIASSANLLVFLIDDDTSIKISVS
jgi:hypothetical protein